jgi:flagellar hook-basal body complex protein FliE
MITPVQGVSSPVNSAGVNAVSSSQDTGFATYLAQALDQVNALSNNADQLATEFAAGGPVTVDQLMIAEQKASLAVDLVVQVRNRIVNAYQTIMNMQI